MKLLHLIAHNVFSIGTIELNLKDRGLTLVTGWSYDDKNGNMAGKSSLARNSIVWGMFGKTVDGVKADAVINTSIKNAKHCGVTLKFEGIDGNTYRIYRSRKPNALVLSVLNPGVLEDEEEWQGLSKRLDRDTQELIDGLLGRDHKTFIQSDFFGQGRERSFLSLPGSEQRAVIEEILPLTSLEEWRVSAKYALAEATAKVERANIEERVQSERVDGIRTTLAGMRDQQASWIGQNQTKLSAGQAQTNRIRTKLASARHSLRVVRQSIPLDIPSGEFLDTNQNCADTLTALLASNQYQTDTLTSEIDKRSSRPNVCSYCDHILPPDMIESNKQAIADAVEKRLSLVKQKGQDQAGLFNALANVGIAKEAVGLERDSLTHEAALALIEEAEERQKETCPFDVTVEAYTAELLKEENIRNAYEGIIKAEAKVRDHFQFWNHAFGSDLKTLLFEKVCPFLEDRTNQYLRELNNSQIKVSFGTRKVMKSGDTKDEFCVTAKTDTGSSVFELFSGAEKQLTSFAVGMALSDMAALQVEGASKFMILDEPFLYQSPENCENIINFIRTHKMGDNSTILLISNEENLSNLISNRIHVVKRNGVSSIE